RPYGRRALTRATRQRPRRNRALAGHGHSPRIATWIQTSGHDAPRSVGGAPDRLRATGPTLARWPCRSRKGDAPAAAGGRRDGRLPVSRSAVPRWIAPAIAALALSAAHAPGVAQPPPAALWLANGTVQATALVGDTLYIGGNFSYVGPRNGGAGLLDATTGDPVAVWPAVNGDVYCTIPDGSGGWYIGGIFTTVGGLPRDNIAHVLPNGSV